MQKQGQSITPRLRIKLKENQQENTNPKDCNVALNVKLLPTRTTIQTKISLLRLHGLEFMKDTFTKIPLSFSESFIKLDREVQGYIAVHDHSVNWGDIGRLGTSVSGFFYGRSTHMVN